MPDDERKPPLPAVVVPGPGRAVALPAAVQEGAREALRDAYARNTVRAYRAAWEDFGRWCEAHAVVPLPADPATIAAYLGTLAEAGLAMATLEQRVAAIAKRHELAGHPSPSRSPIVRAALVSLARRFGRPQDVAAPVRTAHLQAITARAELTPQERALLLVGFAGALRRSELVGLDLERITWEPPAGIRILIPRSKTDQRGEGQTVAIRVGANRATCPVRTLAEHLQAARIADGAVFRGVRGARLGVDAVNRLVKRAVSSIGLPAEKYSAHSLRAGFVTEAAERGVELHRIQEVTRHASLDMLARYIRAVRALEDSATGKVGL